MTQVVVWALLPLGLVFAGIAMLWCASWVRQNRRDKYPFTGNTVTLTVFGWVVTVVGCLVTILATSLFMFPLVAGIGAVVVISTVVRYWNSETRYLVWSLAEAAERSIPLERAARAYASEHGGMFARSARRLADYLEAGVPLSIALSRSWVWVSSSIRMAADIGEKSGTLGPSMRKAVRQSNAIEDTIGSVLAKFVYLSCIVLVMFFVMTFMMIKIVPTFEQMFEEFGLALPNATILLITVSRLIVQYWFLLFPMVLGLTGLVVMGVLIQMGVPVPALPIIRRFRSPFSNATILHSLATAVEHERTVPENLLLLSGLAPTDYSRRRLAVAVGQIESGAHWADALQHSGLISAAQNAIFRSAERAGNLAWALNEMADSTIRRAGQRARALLSVVFPGCLLLFGVCVFFTVVGMMMPLFSLISSLA
jgi:type II secretory pathway component PulF